MPEASPFWQNAFLVWGIVSVGLCVLWGWRMGVVRALTLGLAVAGACAAFATAQALGPALPGWLIPLPGVVLGLAVGGLAAGTVFFCVWLLGALLFKRTAHQSSGVARFFYGVGGAACGAVLGLALVWGVMVAVRALGNFDEAWFGPGKETRRSGMVELTLVKLKRSVEAGDTGKLLAGLDPLPEDFYRILEKAGRVAADPRAMARLLEAPGVDAVVTDSRFVALTADPDVNDAVRGGQFAGLLQNARVIAALSDPALLGKLKKIEIEKALDYALAKSPAAPAPANP